MTRRRRVPGGPVALASQAPIEFGKLGEVTILISRHTLAALAAIFALTVGAPTLSGATAAAAECLNRAACDEIRAEVAGLRPDLRSTRQNLRKARAALGAVEPGSERWLARRKQLKRLKKTFRSLKRELRALQLDYRHQACSNC